MSKCKFEFNLITKKFVVTNGVSPSFLKLQSHHPASYCRRKPPRTKATHPPCKLSPSLHKTYNQE